MGISVTGNGFSVGTGGTNPGYFNSNSFQIADDLDLVRGTHQLSIGANWIHSRIETVNNRPTNGQFTFNGQTTGLSLADFMLGAMSGGFVQGNPVYDYDHNDYIGVYAQDNWRVQAERHGQPGHSLGAVPADVEHLLVGQPLRPVAVRPERPQHRLSAGAGRPDVPRRCRAIPSDSTTFGKKLQFAPRVGVVWTPQGDERTSVRASWGIFYDTPHLFFNTRFANNPPWGAQITITNPPGGFADPYSAYPGGNPFPALNTGWADAAVPGRSASTSTRRSTRGADVAAAVERHACSISSATGWPARGYLGNHSSHLWRATELNSAVYGPGATTGNTNARRVLMLQNPAQGQFYGTIGQLDDTGRANYNAHAPVAPAPPEEQPERALQLHALEVHERSGDDGAHRARRS